jgi:putative Ca2+/H+ antiporter (TMEM165/GDT1 family)
MRAKHLFIVTAMVEVGTGLALAIAPSVLIALLLGSPLSTTVEMTVGRVAGAALFSLGAACWLARDDEQSRAATGLIVSMLLYNTAAVALLGYAGMVSRLAGVALWPGILLHVALATWCIECLRTSRRKLKETTPPSAEHP